MAVPESFPSDDRDFTDSREDGDDTGFDANLSARSLTTSNSESQIVMNGSLSKEMPSSLSLLLLQPSQKFGDENALHEAEIEIMPPHIGVIGTSAQIPEAPAEASEVDRTVQAFSAPHILDAQAIVDPDVDPKSDRAEHVQAITPQLTPIPEAVEEEIHEEQGQFPDPESSPLRSADEENSTLRAVTSTDEASVWPSTRSTSTSLLENHSETIAMQPENFANPSSWIPSDPELEDSSSQLHDTEERVDMSSTEDSTNDVEGSIFDNDDDYHSDTSTYTASLLSDVKDYAYENGRRYHSYREGHYVLPNDEQEQDRQDLLHHVRNLVLNGALLRAPLGKSIQRVLDIGTGTGIWAIDFADSYPSAEVIGTDLSPIQPSWVPPNLRFLVDDAEEPWLFSASRPFDFIHARDLGGAIADWPRLLRQAYEHLKPGGWIELQEFEVTLKSDDDTLRLAPTLCEYLGRLHEASEAFQRPMNIAEGHRQRVVEAGFAEVRDEVYKVSPMDPGSVS
ncbi:uncharacterized protein N7458_003966 [Penicillium daleae]|uniref:Methyltransferase domain-containing protein n=1 Tax=Penicillium daleae TaxID=63821 RepID=A0AAD6CBN3_9EURO|nr:uncharacterized protein N7458_003966 [Penicillium daleae]KAJ5455702.1 hypothetical protein N7458_003966 [Penicillium daleae]